MSYNWLKERLPKIDEIQSRLKEIFPKEVDVNGYITREMGAKTVFAMLYCLCVNGDEWIRPATITCMTDEQADIRDLKARRTWLQVNQSSRAPRDIPGRWYKPNTREPIRDETLREMVRLNAVVERKNLPTTSPLPRYSLQSQFANLFNPDIQGDVLTTAIDEWKNCFLSQSLLARAILLKKMAASPSDGVLVHLPNGEVRKMSVGPSSELAKAVVEQFTKHFMKEPVVILISESARKLLMKDDEMCQAVGFNVDVSKTLPDLILADLGENPPTLVFAECVATDGPINERRKEELMELALAANFRKEDCLYVTVFKDRADQVSRKLSPSVAWGTYIWHASEPREIIFLREWSSEKKTSIRDLIKA